CAVNASAAPSSAARDQTHPFRAPSTCRVSSPSNARRSSPVSHGVLSGSVSSATSAMRSTPPSSSTDRPAQARTLRQRSASFVSSAISASLAASACSTAAITVSVRCVIQTHVSKSWCPCEPSSTRSALSTSRSRWITVGVTLPPLVVVVRCRSGATPRLTRSTPSIHGTCRDRCSCATALRRAAFCAHGRPSSRRRLPRRTPSPTALAWASWLVLGVDDGARSGQRFAQELVPQLEPRDLGVPLAHGGDKGGNVRASVGDENLVFDARLPLSVPAPIHHRVDRQVAHNVHSGTLPRSWRRRVRPRFDGVQIQRLVGTHGRLACTSP